LSNREADGEQSSTYLNSPNVPTLPAVYRMVKLGEKPGRERGRSGSCEPEFAAASSALVTGRQEEYARKEEPSGNYGVLTSTSPPKDGNVSSPQVEMLT